MSISKTPEAERAAVQRFLIMAIVASALLNGAGLTLFAVTRQADFALATSIGAVALLAGAAASVYWGRRPSSPSRTR